MGIFLIILFQNKEEIKTPFLETHNMPLIPIKKDSHAHL